MYKYELLLKLLTEEKNASSLAEEYGDAWTVGFLGSAIQDIAELVGRELLIRIVDVHNEASALDPFNAQSLSKEND